MPRIGASKPALARQLAVLIALLGSLVAGSSDAEAILCEIETEDSQLMSTVAEAAAIQSTRIFLRPTIFDAAPKQECDATDNADCDIKLPVGHPQPPETQTSVRPTSALPPNQQDLSSARPAPGHYDNMPGELRPGHYGTPYRPPRS